MTCLFNVIGQSSFCSRHNPSILERKHNVLFNLTQASIYLPQIYQLLKIVRKVDYFYFSKFTKYNPCVTSNNSLPANVSEAVESGLCVLARPWGVEASFTWLVEERSVVIPIVWIV